MKRKNTAAGLRILVVSSQSSDSGSNLRGRYLHRALQAAGAQARFLNGVKARPGRLDYLISMLLYVRMLFIPCDVLIGLKPFPNITLYMLIKKWLGCFVVIDIDDLDFSYRTGLLGRLNKWLQLPFPRRFDMATYHIDRLRPLIASVFKVPENRLYQLSQGVDLAIYAPAPRGAWHAEFLERHKLTGKKIVVHSAHLNIASDLDAVLEIIRQAHVLLPEIYLLVIGGGPLENHFRALAGQKQMEQFCLFTGYLAPTDVARHLLLGDAGIVYYKDVEANYYRESMKLREMLALGLPVVCNDVGELTKFRAYTYQTGSDYGDCAGMLVQFLRHGGDQREKAGMEYVRGHMDWRKIGQDFYGHLCRQFSARLGT